MAKKPITKEHKERLKRIGFQKGTSGNPKGRPPLDPEIKELLRELSPAAIKRATYLMDNAKNEMVQAKMVEYILDRFSPKAAQKVDHDHRHTFDFKAALKDDSPRQLDHKPAITIDAEVVEEKAKR